jgi:hypothetical protein
MVVSGLDIYRTANLLIQQHGTEDAKLYAAQRADEMLAKGDLNGDQIWRLIFKAIGELASTEISPGASSH